MPKLKLANPNICPPDGFRYVFPSDGWVAHSWTYTDWIQAALNHLTANNLPIPEDLPAVMEYQLCLTLEPGWCSYDDANRSRPNTVMGWNDVMGGIATFSSWIASGMRYVQPGEAERRALICSRCYLNVNVSGCAACHKAVAEITKDRSTKYDFALKACGVCRCLLKAKVWFPLDVLQKENDNVQEQYPGFCWLKK